MSVRVLKLSSMETIIGYIDYTSTEKILIVNDPYYINTYDKNIVLAPYLSYSADNILTISQSQVVYSYTPNKKIIDEYENARKKCGISIKQETL